MSGPCAPKENERGEGRRVEDETRRLVEIPRGKSEDTRTGLGEGRGTPVTIQGGDESWTRKKRTGKTTPGEVWGRN